MTDLDAPLGVAVVGFGTVGRAVARILQEPEHASTLRLRCICNRQVERKRVDWVPDDVVWTEDFDRVLAADVDIVVELIGGLDPATTWIRRALEAGKSVVTANKLVMATHGGELLDLAAARDRGLGFEAAVAGGIPILHGLRDGLAGDRPTRIQGILNGTCNYILTRMEAEGVSFDEALTEAQSLGYAEADPSSDVDGGDAQAKLAILAAMGLGCRVQVDALPLATIRTVEAIDFAYARRLGCAIRQVARVERLEDGDTVVGGVQPALVPRASTLARVEGSQNVVVVDGERCGETAFSGFGAGGDPTGAAVVSDLVVLARRGPAALRPGRPVRPASVVTSFVSPHYVRFVVADRPGIVAALAGAFADHRINLDSLLQEPGFDKTALPFVVTLEACDSAVVSRALDAAASLDFNVRPPLWMPILAPGEPRS